MRQSLLIAILIFVFSGFSVWGEGSKTRDQHISFAWENDLYYQHDYYYTNGFQIGFFHDKLQNSPINWLLIPAAKKNDWLRYSGLQLRQEIFTPKNLAADSISIGDHPYSSTLTLSQVSVVNMPEKMMRIVSDLRLGVMGPASLGFRTQELAHSVSNPSRPPLGWEYQLQNDFIINYDIRLEKGVFSNDLACIGFMGKGRLGTLHTDLQAGLWFILDARQGHFQRFGPSGEPGLNVVFKLSASAQHVFYDATLQGGLFNKSSPYVIPSDKVMPWIGNLDVSLSFELLAHQLEFYTRLASPRFHMAVPHGWMAISYKFWF